MKYAPSSTHWLDAFTPPIEHYPIDLHDSIALLIQEAYSYRHTTWEAARASC